jgi:hypothetical protein
MSCSMPHVLFHVSSLMCDVSSLMSHVSCSMSYVPCLKFDGLAWRQRMVSICFTCQAIHGFLHMPRELAVPPCKTVLKMHGSGWLWVAAESLHCTETSLEMPPGTTHAIHVQRVHLLWYLQCALRTTGCKCGTSPAPLPVCTRCICITPTHFDLLKTDASLPLIVLGPMRELCLQSVL